MARSIRSGAMPGTTSTHLMEWGSGGAGKKKYSANPTIFPNKDGSWTDLRGQGNAAYNEAAKRGEVFGFNSQRKAEKFAAGSWKKGPERREAMKTYRANKKK